MRGPYSLRGCLNPPPPLPLSTPWLWLAVAGQPSSGTPARFLSEPPTDGGIGSPPEGPGRRAGGPESRLGWAAGPPWARGRPEAGRPGGQSLLRRLRAPAGSGWSLVGPDEDLSNACTVRNIVPSTTLFTMNLIRHWYDNLSSHNCTVISNDNKLCWENTIHYCNPCRVKSMQMKIIYKGCVNAVVFSY